MSTLTWD